MKASLPFPRRCRVDSSPSCGRHADLDPLSAQAKGSSVELTDMRLFDRRTREPYVRYAISTTYNEPGHAPSGIRRSLACQEPGNSQTSVKSAIQRKRHRRLLLWAISRTARIRRFAILYRFASIRRRLCQRHKLDQFPFRGEFRKLIRSPTSVACSTGQVIPALSARTRIFGP